MLILLFSILWGIIIALTLSAPYGYYPLFIIIIVVSIIIFFISRRIFKPAKKYFYIIGVAFFFLSYTLCSFIIFKNAAFHYPNFKNVSSDKKAIIFYCEGEMEKYTPYYANHFFEDKPYFLKPLYAIKIKNIYHDIKINKKNVDLTDVASEVKNSILNYKPYYFYIAYSGYLPDIADSIDYAVNDGCSHITILNYSSDCSIEEKIREQVDLSKLNAGGVKITFTKPVYKSSAFLELYKARIENMPFKWDGVLILDNENETTNKLKDTIVSLGYDDSQVLINNNIEEAMNYFKQMNYKKILYINLAESGSGLNADIFLPKEFSKYSDSFKITGLKSWGYDKKLVKAAIEVFKEAENKQKN